MALGYEGYVSLKVDAIEDVALGQGGGTPKGRQRLESSSGYGGQISSPVEETGIGLPRNYDWEVYDGSMDLDVHEDFLTNQIKAWIFDRQKGAQAYFQTREGNVQQFNKCYWNNLSLSAGEGSFLTSSISFVAMQRDNYIRGGDYENNKTGSNTNCAGGTNPTFPDFLTGDNTVPIPYWNTFVEIDGTLVEFTNWTLNFTQEVVKFFGCFAVSGPQEPKYVGAGPMSVSFSGDYMFVDSDSLFDSPDTLTSLYVTMGSEQIKLEDLELTTDTDNLQAQGTLTPVSIEYSAYTLVQ